jgi:hypothetical protein
MGGGYCRPFFMAMPQALGKFPAVIIATGANCCGAVSVLEEMRILATHAPRLPLPNCTMPAECRCRFKKFFDRREDEEGRRFRYGQERGAWYSGAQKRKSKGRRTKD